MLPKVQAFRRARFKHYCFISYPHAGEHMERIARAFERELTRHLRPEKPAADWTDNKKKPMSPYVFLDQSHTRGRWEEALGHALCHSVTLIALWVPEYCTSRHTWCGREWKGMGRLARKRFRGDVETRYVIPLSKAPVMEPEVAAVQGCPPPEQGLLIGYEKSKEFRCCLKKALDHIRHVCGEVERLRPKPIDYRKFRLPKYGFPPSRTPKPPSRKSV